MSKARVSLTPGTPDEKYMLRRGKHAAGSGFARISDVDNARLGSPAL
jgi:hypothetical protein